MCLVSNQKSKKFSAQILNLRFLGFLGFLAFVGFRTVLEQNKYNHLSRREILLRLQWLETYLGRKVQKLSRKIPNGYMCQGRVHVLGYRPNLLSEHHVVGTQSTRIDKEIKLVKTILICDVCVTNKTWKTLPHESYPLG